jgi:transcriptional regulator with XRE-family HTH domain
MGNKEIPKFNELKVLLLRKNDTYEDLAQYIGSTKATIVRKISGKTPWSWVDMQKIRLHYQLTNEQFIDIFFKQEVTEM